MNTKLNEAQCKAIYEHAQVKGVAAAKACVPNPVVFYAAGLGDKPLNNEREVCLDGNCGTAWVTIRPAKGPFVNFCKDKNYGDRGAYGGLEVSANLGFDSQSIERKEAYCEAFAEVLKGYNIRATVHTYLT